MGKNEHCTYCVKFHRRTMGPTWGCNRVVEVPGCEKCDRRHEAEVLALKARITHLESGIVSPNKSCDETELAKLLAKSTNDRLDLRTKYAQFLWELTVQLSLKLDEVKNDDDSLPKHMQCLQLGDVVVPGIQAAKSSWQKVVKSQNVKKPKEVVADVNHSSHQTDPFALKARIAALEREIEDKKKSCEKTEELSKLLAKTAGDMLAQQTEYEQLLADMKLETSVQLNKVKDENKSLRKKLQFLQVCRNSLSGDIILAVPGLQVAAHRAILASKSPSWHKVVRSEDVEKSKEVTYVNGISPSVLEAVVDFCYTGEVTFSALEPPEEVWRVAHALELGLLKEYCETELCQRLTVENVPEMLKLSRKYEGMKLQEEAGKIFKEHFDELKSKIYEVLEGPDTSTVMVAESSRVACPEVFHEIGFDAHSQ